MTSLFDAYPNPRDLAKAFEDRNSPRQRLLRERSRQGRLQVCSRCGTAGMCVCNANGTHSALGTLTRRSA